MDPKSPIPRKIVIVAHPKVPEAAPEAKELAAYLQEHDTQTVHGMLYDEGLRKRVKAGEFDLLIALGGDGTILRAGHLCAPGELPLLGINMGRLGFLMEIHKQEWRSFIPRLLAGDYWLENRMMLTAEHWRAGEKQGSWDVLNEVVVSRGQTIRAVHIATMVDGRHLTTFVADALIAATPTGSTAYALAAGGPILPPELRNILLVPVAPHLSLDRALVLAEGSSVSMTVDGDSQAVFSVDGQAPVGLAESDRVDVFAGKHSVHFIRFQDPGYFYRNLTPHMGMNQSNYKNG
ncbi:MAG TPA: NAD(+)/NADH kinase [Anaerolineales bacterium]|nr:NAD(+)/NADH kinase [Anaerolineales bacterium]